MMMMQIFLLYILNSQIIVQSCANEHINNSDFNILIFNFEISYIYISKLKRLYLQSYNCLVFITTK